MLAIGLVVVSSPSEFSNISSEPLLRDVTSSTKPFNDVASATDESDDDEGNLCTLVFFLGDFLLGGFFSVRDSGE